MVVKKEEGQALIEFIIFLPFMVMIYGIVLILGNAINGSINQQKVTRGYFYYRLQNNSYITKPSAGAERIEGTWTQYGHFFIGWADYLESESPVAPCYKMVLPLFGQNPLDTCERKYTEPKTQNIRIGTVYGLCGVTYFINNNVIAAGPTPQSGVEGVVNGSGCFIK
jgi:hypothetical protein